MDSNFVSQAKIYLTSRPVWLGAFLGFIITLIAIFVRPFTLFRYANDPLQLVQPIIQLRFGLINFNWQLPLFHLAFIVSISLAAPLGLRIKWPKLFSEYNAVLAARTASLISIGYVWWLRVDAIPVLIWYGFSTWISFMAISWLTKWVAAAFGANKLRF